jgi:hypothetical protein
MNAPVALAPRPAKGVTDIHRFRGEYLDRFGAIETWVVERLLDASGPETIPPMLGPRLEELRKALDKNPAIVKDRVKVQSVLTALIPHQTLRCTLAHALVHEARDGTGELVYIFQAPATRADQAWQFRSVLRVSELTPALNRLKDLANRLRQQTPAKPSSPLRPKPAGAGGP